MLALSLSSTFASAELITVTQTFKDVAWDDYGVASGLGYGQSITGDWVFRGTVDTKAVNQYGWPDEGASYAATVTLTQSSLGLIDAPIVNVGYIYFHSDRVGFAFNTNGFAPWTRTKYPEVQFDNFTAFPLHIGHVLPLSTHTSNGFGPQWSGFALSNGLRIYGWGLAAASAVNVQSSSPVPEPSTWVFLLSGFGAMALARRWGLIPKT